MNKMIIRDSGTIKVVINEDTDVFDGTNGEEEKVAVVLYIPNVKEVDHEHITLRKSEVEKLRDWCTEFLDNY